MNADDPLRQARQLGMDQASVEREARAMGLDVPALLLRYASDYVECVVDRKTELFGIRVD